MAITPVHEKCDIITRGESLAMKGVGILLIVTHNLAHLLGVTKHDCNEFNFEQESANLLYDVLLHPSHNIALQLSSLVGYCGIYIFLFLSAFGLVRKYEQGAAQAPAPHAFVALHYKKLWKLMLPGLLAAILVRALLPDFTIPLKRCILTQAFMISNWMNPPYDYVIPGPYWFLGMMVEVYVIYRLFLYVPQGGTRWRKWLPPIVFAGITLAPQFYWSTAGWQMIYLRYNFFVAGLSFAAGLIVARYGGIPRLRRRWWALVCVASVALFVVMQQSAVLWILSCLVAAVSIIAFVKALPPIVMPPLEWVGKISAFLFIMHPVVRYFALVMKGTIGNHLLVALYLIAALLAAAAYHRIAPHIPWPKWLR